MCGGEGWGATVMVIDENSTELSPENDEACSEIVVEPLSQRLIFHLWYKLP